ncbi:carbohydrate ABC transporter permease [Paenibacillus baekrokdamisoli]|nr:carbohydrate ABC transporter permease [Paenibacillus baekrokdamisoli]
MIFSFLALFAAFTALPLMYIVSSALKPLDELFRYPPRFIVVNPTLTNFTDLFQLLSNSWVPFSRYVFNTMFITLGGTAGLVLFASMAAYPLAKHKFPGSRSLFTIVVLALMFSPHVTAIPNFMIMSLFGWIDSYAAVIVPAFALPLGMYLMTQFMSQIPPALLEAAKIDGASEYRILWKIVMPLVRPAWLTVIIFSFQSLWSGNSASTYIFSEEKKSMDYALSQILMGGIARSGAAAAVTLLMMIVPITIFIMTQRKILQTMSTSGLKE